MKAPNKITHLDSFRDVSQGDDVYLIYNPKTALISKYTYLAVNDFNNANVPWRMLPELGIAIFALNAPTITLTNVCSKG
jgi:hypothetical protein